MRAVVTVLELHVDPTPLDNALLICGSKMDMSAGGRVTESVVEGGGWVVKYWRKCVTSSYTCG